METVIYDASPLAEYLKDEGEEQHRDWARQEPDVIIDTPPPSPPSPSFAPTGRPFVKARFRKKIPDSLNLKPHNSKKRLSSLQDGAAAVATKLYGADNSKLLEQFRYTIIASQLLSGHSILVQHVSVQSFKVDVGIDQGPKIPSQTGLLVTAVGTMGLAWFVSWLYDGWTSHISKRRLLVSAAVFAIAAIASQAYIKQQWLSHVREQTLAEVTTFVSKALDFDSASSGALALIQEVELVSRGYRFSAPMPPISRIEDRSQIRRCKRIRKALREILREMIERYQQASLAIKPFSEQLDLERYYDIYDISDLHISDASQGYSESEFDDIESIRTLKIVASRFHVMRKMFLCSLLSMEARGGDSDFLRWTIVFESLRMLNQATATSFERLRALLEEDNLFPAPASAEDKGPLSPGRERWRSQLRKLNSLSTGIRGLQAKMTLLREESDRALNEASDISELGPNLMEQYDSIGADLQVLQVMWQDGKAALASCIDRNEKRLSSISGIQSPTSSFGGSNTIEEPGGSVSDALRALTGEGMERPDLGSKSGESEEIFEAVAGPPQRPKGLLTREDRIAKMREERERRAELKEKPDANRGMLKELEMVINLRPNKNKTHTTLPPNSKRVVPL